MTEHSQEAVTARGVDRAMFNAYVAGVTLNNVEVVRLVGERLGAGPLSQANFETSLSYAQYESGINYRYDVIARLLGETGDHIGRLEVAVVVVTTSTAPADEPIIALFANTSGAVIATSFIREVVATTAQRIGFLGVIMPLMRITPGEPDLEGGERD